MPGLNNKTQICFQNSIYQCLAATNINVCSKIRSNYIKKLGSLLNRLQQIKNNTILCSKSLQKYYSNEFCRHTAEDAADFLLEIFSKLPKSIINCFIIDTITDLNCIKCKHRSQVPQQFKILRLKIQHSFQSMIDEYLSKKLITNFYCNKCNLVVDIDRKISILKWPDILIIKLGKFHKINGQLEKVETDVHFPNVFSINNNTITYHIIGFVSHVGTNIKNGHYFADVVYNNKWYHANDTIFKILHNLPKKSNAYILFYLKKK